MYALRRFSKLLKDERFTNIKDLIKRLNDERRGRMNHYALVKWGGVLPYIANTRMCRWRSVVRVQNIDTIATTEPLLKGI